MVTAEKIMGLGDKDMLETSQERVKLLMAGSTGKTIERLYIRENNFKILRSPIFLDMVEIETKDDRNNVS
jgi:hypothetical protein